MKQASSRELFGYWTARRGTRPAPERGEIEPSAIRRALGDVFILEFDRHQSHPFRLAGTRVCALFGRELKNEPFLSLWDAPSRARDGEPARHGRGRDERRGRVGERPHRAKAGRRTWNSCCCR